MCTHRRTPGRPHPQPSSPEALEPRLGLFLLILLTGILLAGCATDPNTMQQIFPMMGPGASADVQPQEVASPAPVTQASPTLTPTPTPTPLPEVTATVRNRRVNIRSGPGLDFPILAKAQQGDAFQAIGRNPESSWWRICCIQRPGDKEGQATQPAWIAASVVTVTGPGEELPVVTGLFPDDFTARWSVEYECGSQRCAVPRCTGTVTAKVRRADSPRWLEVDRTVTWAGNCGEEVAWIHQIDRYTGQDRYGSQDEILFQYWAGAVPGPATDTFILADGRAIAVWCTGPLSQERPESDGWITVYDGEGCYDTRTGLLASAHYTKRWLFTGTFEGEEYERAYFGDFEVYKVQLQESNAELASAGPAP